MSKYNSSATPRKKSKPLFIILFAIGVLLILWFSVISPAIFSSRMLSEIYPGSEYNRGIKHTNDEYVPHIPIKDVEGKKAVTLLREVHYDRTFRTQPVDWSCNSKYLPAAYKTNNPDDVRYVVYVNKYRDKVGEYTNSGNATRINFFVSIIDRTTGEVLASKIFTGGDPPSKISSGNSGGVGADPDADRIMSWVGEVLP